MFSALVVLNLFGADLILETIHLSVCWSFLNGLKPKCSPNQQCGISLLLGWEQLLGFWGQPVCEDLFCWQSVVLFHFLNVFPGVPIILTGCIKSMSSCGGKWNSADVAPGAVSPLLGNLCAEETEAALFQLVTKAWPPWLVCIVDAFLDERAVGA